MKNKTDREDGLKLARMSAMGEISMVHVPEKTVREWRSLILFRHKLIDRRTSVRNAIHSILVAQGKAMPGRRSVWSDDSMSQLAELANPLSECTRWRNCGVAHLKMELEHLDELCRRIVELDQKLDALAKPMRGCDV